MSTKTGADTVAEDPFQFIDKIWLQQTMDKLANLCRGRALFLAPDGHVLISAGLKDSAANLCSLSADREEEDMPALAVSDALPKERLARSVPKRAIQDITVSRSLVIDAVPIGTMSLQALATPEFNWKRIHDELKKQGVNIQAKENRPWRKEVLQDFSRDRETRIEHVVNILADTVVKNALTSLREQTLAKIAWEVSAKASEEEALAAVLQLLPSFIKFDVGRILLVDWRRDVTTILASTAEEENGFGGELSLKMGITGWVARNNRAARVAVVREDNRYYRYSRQVGSELAVPICLGPRVLGVFDLEAEEDDHFTECDEQDLIAIAANLAPALAEKVWHNRFDALEALNKTLTDSPNLSTMLKKTATDIFHIFPHLDLCNIWLYDEVWQTLKLVGEGSRDGRSNSNDQRGYYIPLNGSITGRAVREGKSREAEIFLEDPEFFRKDFARETGAKVMLSTPMLGPEPGKPWGCINIFSTQPYRFTRDDRRLLETVSRFLAAAIQNLHYALVLAAHRETAEVCSKSKITPLVLDRVMEIVRAKTGARAASVFLPDCVLDRKNGASERLYLKGTTGFPGISPDKYQDVNYEPGEGMTGWVWKHREAIRPPGKYDRGDLQRRMGQDFRPKHKHIEYVLEQAPDGTERDFLMVPIELTEETAGVLRASAKTDNLPFTSLDQEILEAIAKQLASALSAAEELEDRIATLESLSRRFASLSKLASIISGSISDEENLLEALASHSLAAVDGATVDIHFYNSSASRFERYPHNIAEPDHGSSIRSGMGAVTNSLVEKTFSDQRAQHVTVSPDVTLAINPSVAAVNTSLFLAPLSGGTGKELGVITVAKSSCSGFHENDLQTLRCFADVGAALITAGRLLREKGDFIATLVHQLVAPSAALDTNCNEFIRLEPHQNAEQKLLAADIGALAKLVSSVARNYEYMEKWLKESDNTKAVKSNEVQFLPWLDSIVRLYVPLVEYNRQKITFTLCSSAENTQNAAVNIDDVLMCHVLINLLNNAVKYSQRGTTIEVRLSQERPGFFAVSVQNCGCPIKEDETKLIFECGFRTPLAQQMAFGNGIGLAVASKIVHLHDGHLSVTSLPCVHHPGLTINTFTIHLPQASG